MGFSLTPAERRVFHKPSPRPKRAGGRPPGREGPGWGKSGLKGAYRLASGRYEAKFRFRGKVYRFGTFDTADEAAAWAAGKRKELG